jgi:hypothetical protein
LELSEEQPGDFGFFKKHDERWFSVVEFRGIEERGPALNFEVSDLSDLSDLSDWVS